MVQRRAPVQRIVAVALALVVAGCATGTTTDADQQLVAPAPTGEVVLTVVTGDREVDWDMDGLAALPQQTQTLWEPFLSEERTFTGPAWSDVLAASGVPDGTTALTLAALDDYAVDLPADAASLGGALLATTDEGRPIALADGGPIRIVFPDGVPLGENPNLWIWSLRSARTTP